MDSIPGCPMDTGLTENVIRDIEKRNKNSQENKNKYQKRLKSIRKELLDIEHSQQRFSVYV